LRVEIRLPSRCELQDETAPDQAPPYHAAPQRTASQLPQHPPARAPCPLATPLAAPQPPHAATPRAPQAPRARYTCHAHLQTGRNPPRPQAGHAKMAAKIAGTARLRRSVPQTRRAPASFRPCAQSEAWRRRAQRRQWSCKGSRLHACAQAAASRRCSGHCRACAAWKGGLCAASGLSSRPCLPASPSLAAAGCLRTWARQPRPCAMAPAACRPCARAPAKGGRRRPTRCCCCLISVTSVRVRPRAAWACAARRRFAPWRQPPRWCPPARRPRPPSRPPCLGLALPRPSTSSRPIPSPRAPPAPPPQNSQPTGERCNPRRRTRPRTRPPRRPRG